jgi:transcriptional regulator with XRE-family HTH domain
LEVLEAMSIHYDQNNSQPFTDGKDISVCERIKEERQILGLSQEAFSKAVGVHRRSQGHYETGVSVPDAVYLQNAHKAGVDVVYVLTGERTAYWHQALIHVVDIVLDELDLTRRESEFRELWKRGYESHLARMRGGDDKAGNEADQALLNFLRQSPMLLDTGLLSDIIERIEFVSETRTIELSPQAKASAIARLFIEAKVHGVPPDLQAVRAAIEP